MVTQEILQEVFARFDPMGLIGVGAPVDEYGPEAREIFESLETAEDEGEDLTQAFILQTSTEIFVSMFDLDIPLKDPELIKGLKQSAKQIYKMLKVDEVDEDDDMFDEAEADF